MSEQILLKDSLQLAQSYLSPVTVFSSSSKYNQKIQVIKSYGQNELWVNDIRQSGGHISGLWKHALDGINRMIEHPKNVLIFGVGGGTVFKLIRKLYPQTKIDVVDIDAEIIRIARKYFDLEKIGVSHYYCVDAGKFVASIKYDLVIVDLYIGEHVPDFVITPNFMNKLATLITPNGHFIINYYDESAEKRENKLQKLLEIQFKQVQAIPVYENMMFFG
jgi:spermidine synthase